ncbi:MAG: hypothetical protein LQ341_005843 [Variospora aurantia]|nr:MAG: hypothetical protein LQ341_005843 [Variospora aurantia]
MVDAVHPPIHPSILDILTITTYQAIRPYVSGGPQLDPATQRIKVWPFIFIFFGGTGAYVLMVKARANAESPKPRNQQRR